MPWTKTRMNSLKSPKMRTMLSLPMKRPLNYLKTRKMPSYPMMRSSSNPRMKTT